MDLINDIRFDLARAYFSDSSSESIAHHRLDRDNARSLIERLEQVYAQIVASQNKPGNDPQSPENTAFQIGSH